jgi:GSH-dependent disulfide-bond oxidoreductase
MAIFPWYGSKNLQRWTAMIGKRPAVKRGRMVNRIFGDLAGQLRERHEASDFDTKTQDKIDARTELPS